MGWDRGYGSGPRGVRTVPNPTSKSVKVEHFFELEKCSTFEHFFDQKLSTFFAFPGTPKPPLREGGLARPGGVLLGCLGEQVWDRPGSSFGTATPLIPALPKHPVFAGVKQAPGAKFSLLECAPPHCPVKKQYFRSPDAFWAFGRPNRTLPPI